MYEKSKYYSEYCIKLTAAAVLVHKHNPTRKVIVIEQIHVK